MGKEQTKKSRYPSIYSPDKYVTASQYITELLFQKKSKFEKKDLPIRFWRNPEYSKQFVRWQRQANELVKEYGGDAIIAALKDPKSGLKWSLHTEFMLKLIDEHKLRIDEKNARMENSEPIQVTEGDSFRETGIENNKLKKLLELD